MLKPTRTKFKKYQKNFFKRYDNRATLYLKRVKENKISLESLQSSGFTAKQIESFQLTFGRIIKGRSRLELKAFPTIPVTRKPTEARMGKGKGSVDFWTTYVTRGTKVFESFSRINKTVKIRLRSSLAKLPFRVYISE